MAANNGRKLKRRNRWADILAALLLCGFLVGGAFWLSDYLRAKSLNFEAVTDGSIVLTLPGELLVLRHEYVLYSGAAGEFLAQAVEGERVREGAVIGQSGGAAVYAPRGGVVSYELDGWEERLQLDALYELDLDHVFRLLAEEQATAALALTEDELPLANTAANRPVGRLVDNLLDFTVLVKVRDERDLLEEANRLTFTLDNGSSFTAAIRERGETTAGDSYFVFSISASEDQFNYIRYSGLEVIAKDVKGILVPTSAITLNEDGVTGVYVLRKRKLSFVAVTELTSQDGISAVEGLNAYDRIVVNPARAYDGQRIYWICERGHTGSRPFGAG